MLEIATVVLFLLKVPLKYRGKINVRCYFLRYTIVNYKRERWSIKLR